METDIGCGASLNHISEPVVQHKKGKAHLSPFTAWFQKVPSYCWGHRVFQKLDGPVRIPTCDLSYHNFNLASLTTTRSTTKARFHVTVHGLFYHKALRKILVFGMLISVLTSMWNRVLISNKNTAKKQQLLLFEAVSVADCLIDAFKRSTFKTVAAFWCCSTVRWKKIAPKFISLFTTPKGHWNYSADSIIWIFF